MPAEQLNLVRKQNGSFLHDLHATKFCATACQTYVEQSSTSYSGKRKTNHGLIVENKGRLADEFIGTSISVENKFLHFNLTVLLET